MTAAVSGIDLARQALLAAREAAKKNGAATRSRSGAPAPSCGATGASRSDSARRSAG
ncbi:hypothetical protein [Streptomyces amakusaensis]|uniref:Uncharacterized protein n=1 Tax=Streptomyces amakusaensis TaxID=67271 RepID=A0ABW0ASQ1_9ACTN